MSKRRNTAKKRLETWDIERLNRHPQQGIDIADLGEAEFQALKADLGKNGQIQPIEVTPEGRVLDGHQRLDALAELGVARVRVLVRYDLAGDEDAQYRRFLAVNLTRRQLAKLGQVKLIAKLAELESGVPLADMYGPTLDQAKRRIGDRIDMSPRNVSRYLLIARTPTAVQEAFGRGDISLVAASKVALLPEDPQQHIAMRLENGENAKAVLADYSTSRNPNRGTPWPQQARKLITILEAVCEQPVHRWKPDLKLAKRLRSRLTRLIRRIEDGDTMS